MSNTKNLLIEKHHKRSKVKNFQEFLIEENQQLDEARKEVYDLKVSELDSMNPKSLEQKTGMDPAFFMSQFKNIVFRTLLKLEFDNTKVRQIRKLMDELESSVEK